MKFQALRINKNDNVATALSDLKAGDVVYIKSEDEPITILLKEDIPCYHKFALCDIKAGEKIYKYGEIIGQATQSIPAGVHVHVQNVRSLRGSVDL